MIAPQGYVVHFGRRYRILAQFEDTEAGRTLANHFMRIERYRPSVLSVRDGWIFLVSYMDQGEPVR